MEHRQRRRRELFEVKRTGNRRPIAPIPSNAILAGRGMPHLKRWGSFFFSAAALDFHMHRSKSA
jgi:hypothetical protein